MANTDKGTIKIFRYDPTCDKSSYYETYHLEYKDRRVIDVLRDIYNKCEKTLAYRESCSGGVCGCCTILVNKKAVLPCDKMAESEMIIEPLPNRVVIRDLVVEAEK